MKTKENQCSTYQSKSIRDATFDAESHCDHRIANTTPSQCTHLVNIFGVISIAPELISKVDVLKDMVMLRENICKDDFMLSDIKK